MLLLCGIAIDIMAWSDKSSGMTIYVCYVELKTALLKALLYFTQSACWIVNQACDTHSVALDGLRMAIFVTFWDWQSHSLSPQ